MFYDLCFVELLVSVLMNSRRVETMTFQNPTEHEGFAPGGGSFPYVLIIVTISMYMYISLYLIGFLITSENPHEKLTCAHH